MDITDHPFIIEVNTGPGLQGTSFNKYVEAFRTKIAELEAPVRRPIANRAANRVRRAVGADNVEHGQDNVAVNDEALVHIMNAVRNPEEARRVLDLMGR